jgi:hypothetical protein
MSWLWLLVPLVIAMCIGGFVAMQNSKFVYGLGREILLEVIRAAIPFFKNRPKTPQEWQDYRNILATKPGERSASQRERLREIMDQ